MKKKNREIPINKIDKDILDMDILLFSDEVEDPDSLPEIKSGFSKRTVLEGKEERKKPVHEIIVEEEMEYDELPEEFTEEDIGKEIEPPKPKRKMVSKEKPGKNKVREVEEDISERLERTSYLYNEETDTEVAMLKNKLTGECFTIDAFPYKVGKLPDNNLIIADNVVSRHHAEIHREGDKYFIKDNTSLNGTFVNGYKIPPNTEVEIKNGQEILFANKKFSFHDR